MAVMHATTTPGETYRSRRLAKTLSILELAAMSGVTARTIRRIEYGEHKRPQPKTVRALAKALEIDPRELSPETFDDS